MAVVTADSPHRYREQPSVVGKYSAPQPDTSVVAKRGDYYEHAHPEPRDVLLVIEAADTTLAFDREVKAGVYARSGVPEVWIFDLQHHQLLVYGDRYGDRDGEVYRRQTSAVKPGITEVPGLPGVSVDLSALLAG